MWGRDYVLTYQAVRTKQYVLTCTTALVIVTLTIWAALR